MWLQPGSAEAASCETPDDVHGVRFQKQQGQMEERGRRGGRLLPAACFSCHERFTGVAVGSSRTTPDRSAGEAAGRTKTGGGQGLWKRGRLRKKWGVDRSAAGLLAAQSKVLRVQRQPPQLRLSSHIAGMLYGHRSVEIGDRQGLAVLGVLEG